MSSEVEVIRRRGVAGRVFAVVNINAKLQNYLQKIHLPAISLATLKVNGELDTRDIRGEILFLKLLKVAFSS